MKTLNQDTNLTKARRGTHGVVVSFRRGLDLSGSIQGAGGEGDFLAVRTGTSTQCSAMTNTTHFTCYDGNGNVTALVNAADSSERARYEYSPFGEPLRATGPLARLNPIRFSTQYADDVTGDSKYLYRDYDTSTGRWPNQDPIGERGGANLYGFVRNNPANLIDSDGRAPMGWPVVSPPGYPPSIPPKPPSDTSIRKCNRKIDNPSNDFVIGCANLRGHDYFDWPDGDGGRNGVGFRDPNGKDGDLPQSEAGSQPRSCRPCYKSHSPLKSGAGSGKPGTSASDDEIRDCLKNRPLKGNYGALCNNCNDWASGAAKDCGRFCP